MAEQVGVLDPAAVLGGIFLAWRARDKAAVLSYFADGAVYAMHLPPELVPYGGETRGKPSISDRLQMILDHFDTVDFVGTVSKVAGPEAHGVAHYTYRHKLTGEEIEAKFRVVADVEVETGRVLRLTEFHDVEKVRAFLRLVAYSAAPDGS